MGQYSCSMSRGNSAILHVQRDEKYVEKMQQKGLLKNVEKTLTNQNIILKNCESLESEFNALFQDSLDKFNANKKSQHRLNEMIDNYYKHIKSMKPGKKTMKTDYEYVIQFGGIKDGYPPNAKELLTEVFNNLNSMPYMHINYAAIHVDEATPHLHVNITFVADGYKKGMEKRPSINKAISQMRKVDRYKAYEDLLSYTKDIVMTELLEKQGDSRLVKGNNFEHQEVEDYKRRENLRNDVEQLESVSSHLTNQVEYQQEQVNKLSDEQECLRQGISKCKSEIKQHESEIRELQDNSFSINQQESQLKQEVAKLEERAGIEDRITEIRERIERVREDIKQKWGAVITRIREMKNNIKEDIPRYTSGSKERLMKRLRNSQSRQSQYTRPPNINRGSSR